MISETLTAHYNQVIKACTDYRMRISLWSGKAEDLASYFWNKIEHEKENSLKHNHRWSLRLLFALRHYKQLLLLLLLLGRKGRRIRWGRVTQAWNRVRRWRWKQFHWSDHLHGFKLKKRTPWQQRLSLCGRVRSAPCDSHSNGYFLRLSSTTNCSVSASPVTRLIFVWFLVKTGRRWLRCR